MNFKRSLLSVLLAAAVIPAVHAESAVTSPASNVAPTNTAAAHVDVTVVIPAVLALRVGTGGGVGSAVSTVDNIRFEVPITSVASGTPVTATPGSGDIGNGAVTVRVFSNVGGDVSLNSGVTGQLTDGAGHTIPWTQITVASAALPSGTAGFTNGAITHPAFSATSGNGTATTLAAASNLVRYEGQWTYTYANGVAVPSGTYGETIAKNGRVTYTATQL